MKVTIIKGPLFEQQEKKVHELLYRMIRVKSLSLCLKEQNGISLESVKSKDEHDNE